jgi:hypothetical protein
MTIFSITLNGGDGDKVPVFPLLLGPLFFLLGVTGTSATLPCQQFVMGLRQNTHRVRCPYLCVGGEGGKVPPCGSTVM